MNSCVLVTIAVGSLGFVQGTLRCIRCEHIDWNETYTFNNVQNIYHLLNLKYNPACAQENPRDRNLYEQQQQEQQRQQQQEHYLNWQNYKQRYDVTQIVCQVQCTYVFGDVIVYFLPFKQSMKLNIHWRTCLNALTAIPAGCYQRDISYTDIKITLQQQLDFFGTGVVEVKSFVGRQCYCSSDFCFVSQTSTSDNKALSLTLVLTVFGYFIIK